MGKRGCILLENEKPKGGGMEKLASFIVDKRNLFFLLYIFALIFSAIATGWVKVEDDITTYLPDTTETRQGLTVMNDNFVTYGTANVMVSNITYDTALDIQSRLEDIEGVTTVEFDDTDEHYTNASALFSVSFDAEVGDERAENALQEIRDELEGSYDTSIYSEVGYDSSADLQSEMVVIVIIAAIIIVLVLTLTSRSYAEVPVLIMTFGAAALLNMGTNFLCGTISFISNSVTVILQLALAIDYAIILCHRFSDEHETMPTREACIAALSKAIPEISSSSLTTISGLAALAFMHFGIGRDLATVLIKAILFSMLCVFTLMPGLLVLFSKLIDKTRHKNLIPKITAVGKFDIKTRFIIPPIFGVIIVAAADLTIALYNPASHGRPDHLKRACDILLRRLPGERLCGIVRNIGREGQSSRILTLAELREAEVDMFCTVLIGSAAVKTVAGQLVTPRGYRNV